VIIFRKIFFKLFILRNINRASGTQELPFFSSFYFPLFFFSSFYFIPLFFSEILQLQSFFFKYKTPWLLYRNLTSKKVIIDMNFKLMPKELTFLWCIYFVKNSKLGNYFPKIDWLYRLISQRNFFIIDNNLCLTIFINNENIFHLLIFVSIIILEKCLRHLYQNNWLLPFTQMKW